jgi:hypothetical protein
MGLFQNPLGEVVQNSNENDELARSKSSETC